MMRIVKVLILSFLFLVVAILLVVGFQVALFSYLDYLWDNDFPFLETYIPITIIGVPCFWPFASLLIHKDKKKDESDG